MVTEWIPSEHHTVKAIGSDSEENSHMVVKGGYKKYMVPQRVV